MSGDAAGPEVPDAPAAGPLPNLVIIGAPRCGTTSLYRHLGEHPDVFMAKGKEMHFFDERYEQGLDWYRSRFAGTTTEAVVGEATPTYMYDPRALGRMASVIPGARLVAVLREPVDRAYSHYWLHRTRGHEERPFDVVVQAEIEGGDRRRYLGEGQYLRALQGVCEHFPRSQLCVLLFEDLVGEPAATFAGTCGFLGIRSDFVPEGLGRPVNQGGELRSVRLRRFTKHLRSPIVRKALGRVNAGRASYPPLDPALRQRLAARFEDDNAALADWLGRDLAAWRER